MDFISSDIVQYLFTFLTHFDFKNVRTVNKRYNYLSKSTRIHSNYTIGISPQNICHFGDIIRVFNGIQIKVSGLHLSLFNKYNYPISEVDYDFNDDDIIPDTEYPLLNDVYAINFKNILDSENFEHKIDGTHKITYGDLNMYSGTFVNGKLNGNGIRQYNDGDKHVGVFQDDFLHGEGHIYYANGSVVEGTFKHSHLCGRGNIALYDKTIIKGTFKDDLLVSGEIKYDNGEFIKGDFKNYRLYGNGLITSNDGEKKEGYFENGLLCGRGVHVLKNGITLEGDFKNDELYGYATKTYPNGYVEKGYYINNILIDQGKRTSNKKRKLSGGNYSNIKKRKIN
jgi:hypothetical protein